jgi:hypothetical protein
MFINAANVFIIVYLYFTVLHVLVTVKYLGDELQKYKTSNDHCFIIFFYSIFYCIQVYCKYRTAKTAGTDTNIF